MLVPVQRTFHPIYPNTSMLLTGKVAETFMCFIMSWTVLLVHSKPFRKLQRCFQYSFEDLRRPLRPRIRIQSQYWENRFQPNDTGFFVTPMQSPPKKGICCYAFSCHHCVGRPTLTNIHCDSWVTSALLAWSSPKGKEPTMKSWRFISVVRSFRGVFATERSHPVPLYKQAR